VANAQFANRELHYYCDEDGRLVIRGRLPAEQGALIVKALEQARVDVSAETSRRLACDCSIVRLVEDEDGLRLSIGHKSRSIPPAIRRALRYRNRGCHFPACTHRHFIDGHHVKHWADGGETGIDPQSGRPKIRAGKRIDWKLAVGHLFN